MRYVAASAIALASALGLLGSNAWGAGVSIEAGVTIGVGAELDIGSFHDRMAPHGRWIETAEYGRAWQPTLVVTDENWRPYVDGGHWTYTDAGWYWDSSYEWGWAAFHYGRWNQDGQYRWLWTPDVTWAPAWVSWRQSDSVYGWAPLPYGSRFEGGVFVGAGLDMRAEAFTFVPSQSFLSVNLGTVVVERGRAAGVYNQTKVINNSYTYNDNRVINNGIPLKQVAKATRQEIKPASIADAKAPTSGGATGGKINAYRPAIKNETPKAAPAGAAADKKVVEPNGGAVQSKAGATATVPAGHVTAEPAAETKKNAAEVKTPEPKAVQQQQPTPGEQQRSQRATDQQRLNEQQPTGQQRASEEQRLNAAQQARQPAKTETKTPEPRATEPSRVKEEVKTPEPKATEPSRAKADAKAPEPRATEPSRAKEDAKTPEPKATEPSRGKSEAKKEEGKSGRD
ncbi:MAG TPA: DUF6600 domain-containing protein [Planctomycetota bacterium]|jgi:hypothetical protein